jgi:hypothetical protein
MRVRLVGRAMEGDFHLARVWSTESSETELK